MTPKDKDLNDKDAKAPKKKAAEAPKAEKKAATKEVAAKKASETPKTEKKAAKPKSAGAQKRGKLIERTLFSKHGTDTKWLLVDAAGQNLGRLSSHVAMLLMGKHKPTFTRFADTGDAVVVINADKVRLTGKKWEDKVYNYHTQFPGGIKTFTARELFEKHPERLIEWAVWGMLPKFKGHMVRRWHSKLRVFTGSEHPHKAQMPQPVKLPNLGIWETK